MPNPQDPLIGLRKAQTIGPSQVGERYVPTTAHKNLWDIAKEYVMGGEQRPMSVAAQDPTGVSAWLKGAGNMPMLGLNAGTLGPGEAAEGPIMQGLKGLYSRVSRVAEALPEYLHPAKALSLFRNNASGEELAYRGVPDFLGSTQGRVSKQAIQEHLGQHPAPQVGVKTLQAPTGISGYDGAGGLVYSQHGTPINPVQYNRPDLNLPGGKDYTESLLQLHRPTEPGHAVWKVEHKPTGTFHEFPTIDDAHAFAYGQEHGGDWTIHHPNMNAQGKYDLPVAGTPPPYTSSHWPNDPNVLTHTREDVRPDQSGALGRFLQEVQSDWHQAGKTKGYHGIPDVAAQEAFNDSREHRNALQSVARQMLLSADNLGYPTAWEAMEDMARQSRITSPDFALAAHDWTGAEDARQAVHHFLVADEAHQRLPDPGIKTGQVPDAPFKDTWPDLALKKHVMDVAGNPDLNWLGFTTGETQGKRYNLANHLQELAYDPGGRILHGYGPGNDRVMNLGNINPDDIGHYVGNDVAQRLLGQPLEDYASGSGQAHRLSGLDLQTGGEGMKSFYDNLLPKRLERILKPFGGTVERGEIPTGTTQTRNFNAEPVGGRGRIYDANTGEEVAQAMPRRPGMVRGRNENQQATIRALGQQYTVPTHTPAWLARFSPEMKAELLKKGLPLLTLMGMMQPEQDGQ